MRRLNSADVDFDDQLESLIRVADSHAEAVATTVREIIAGVRQRGDAALVEYTNRFDRRDVENACALQVDADEVEAAKARIAPASLEALQAAAARIEAFHLRQQEQTWTYTDELGNELGQRITPLDRVGVYVPGGKAAYPSSLLMNVVPARVAGVGEVIMTVPTPDGAMNDTVLAAAAVAGVDRIFTVGGAQAVAAVAYGTETVPRVDKVVGPGNAYVAAAKAQVVGQVGIDMIAGPSEILVVADSSMEPEWLAMDLFSQAEHDEDAQAVLIGTEPDLLDAVSAAIDRLLPSMERTEVIAASLQARGALILAQNWDEAVELINRFAPEHLELAVADPDALLPGIRHAGAIFLGRYSPEALGDYCAGPNHVLPTAGTARFSSPLGVYDFQKRSSLIRCSGSGASQIAQVAETLAYAEGLTAHARSAALRRAN